MIDHITFGVLDLTALPPFTTLRLRLWVCGGFLTYHLNTLVV